MSDTSTNKVMVGVTELIENWWFVYSDEINSIDELNKLDMDDIFHLIRVIYNGYIPLIISDWEIKDGDLWITFVKDE